MATARIIFCKSCCECLRHQSNPFFADRTITRHALTLIAAPETAYEMTTRDEDAGDGLVVANLASVLRGFCLLLLLLGGLDDLLFDLVVRVALQVLLERLEEVCIFQREHPSTVPWILFRHLVEELEPMLPHLSVCPIGARSTWADRSVRSVCRSTDKTQLIVCQSYRSVRSGAFEQAKIRSVARSTPRSHA
jgi:hypothetical protein